MAAGNVPATWWLFSVSFRAPLLRAWDSRRMATTYALLPKDLIRGIHPRFAVWATALDVSVIVAVIKHRHAGSGAALVFPIANLNNGLVQV